MSHAWRCQWRENVMAGYSGTPLIKKLGLKEGFNVAFVNSPENFLYDLGDLPAGITISPRPKSPADLIVLFTKKEEHLVKKFTACADKLNRNGMIWVAWPKKSSGVATDLSFESVQRIGLKAGLVDVKICAIDEMWSGLKFVYRLA